MNKLSKEFILLLEQEDYDEALNYLENETKADSSLLVEYALFLQGLPFDDYVFALEQLDERLKRQTDIRALILKGYIFYVHQGDLSDSIRDDILKYLQELKPSSKYFNQLYTILALYYKNKDQHKYLLTLLKCVELDPLATYPFYLLGKYYKENRESKKSKEAMKRAKENIQHIYSDDEFVNFADFDEFISESVRGVKITKVSYENF